MGSVYTHSRFFHGVVFKINGPCEPNDVLGWLPSDRFRAADVVPGQKKPALHCLYFRPEPFNDLAEESLKAISVKSQGRTLYAYDFYIGSFDSPSGLLHTIAVPLKQMAEEVFKEFHERSEGHERTYVALEMPNAWATLTGNSEPLAKVAATGARFIVRGEDDRVDNLTLVGRDLGRAEAPVQIVEALRQIGGSLFLKRLRLVYQEGGPDSLLGFNCDDLGNFSFFIDQEYRCFALKAGLFRLLDSLGLLRSTPAFPRRKLRKKEVNALYGSELASL